MQPLDGASIWVEAGEAERCGRRCQTQRVLGKRLLLNFFYSRLRPPSHSHLPAHLLPLRPTLPVTLTRPLSHRADPGSLFIFLF